MIIFFQINLRVNLRVRKLRKPKTDSPIIINVKHIQYLYEFEIKDNDDFNLKKTDSKIELNIEESNKISESEKRSVYKGKIDDVKDCVVKTYKKNNGEVYYSIKDLFNDLINLFKAKKLSEKYAEKYQNDTEFIPMNFVDFYIGYEKENSTDELKGILSNVNSNYSEIGERLNLIENFIERKNSGHLLMNIAKLDIQIQKIFLYLCIGIV